MMNIFRAVLQVLVLAILTSCSTFFHEQRSGSSSSLVDYLYPGGEIPPEIDETIPVINLPARVGLAFVPGHGWKSLGEAKMNSLLEIVRAEFQSRDFIERIEIIPSSYLRSKGGFDGLEQVGRLYGVDLIALVSYDQVVNTDDQASSVLYWTIVGAYMIKGTSNDVTTFVDTAVFDLATHRLLFRAPGIDERSKRSTGVSVDEVSREASEQSFTAAMEQMTANLDVELEQFQERIKVDQSVQLVHRDGTGGTGNADFAMILLALLCALFTERLRKL
jgi:rhombotail lipoprotein